MGEAGIGGHMEVVRLQPEVRGKGKGEEVRGKGDSRSVCFVVMRASWPRAATAHGTLLLAPFWKQGGLSLPVLEDGTGGQLEDRGCLVYNRKPGH